MELQQMLFTQGFGTRRVCAGLIQRGMVDVEGRNITDASEHVEVREGLKFSVDGKGWEYHERAYLMLNKPAGYECSQKPGAWPSVYTLLPGPLRQRPNPGKVIGVQAIGRLDQDTTGLLLFSDDGAFIHRMASPKHHVPKIYRVKCAEPVTDQQIAALLQGVVLNDDPKPVRAAACERTAPDQIDLTLTEGKYHQVKRMVAAAGNSVAALHRWKIGQLALPEELKPGEWRWVDPKEITSSP
jgi:16S rRNA pseudouridine516 synthase